MALNNYEFYVNAYKKHGVSAKALNWNNKSSQTARFGVITDVLGEQLADCSVADAGCGFGDLYGYWEILGKTPKKYYGIDAIGEFVDIAKEKYAKENCEFLSGNMLVDKLPMCDWYVASGSLNILNDFDYWLFVEAMLAHSHKGIIFNTLCARVVSPNFNIKTKKEIKEFAKTKGLHVEIKSGYLPNDMTVVVRFGDQKIGVVSVYEKIKKIKNRLLK